MSFSQIGQDMFVAETLDFQRHGTFLDIGCGHWKDINNTLYLERFLGWSGVGVDKNPKFEGCWRANRNSTFVCADATAIDYGVFCEAHGMPAVIDYLSLDLEPPSLTLLALERVLDTCGRRFKVITFETDYYRQRLTCHASRSLLTAAGYTLVQPGEQDDFWTDGQTDTNEQLTTKGS